MGMGKTEAALYAAYQMLTEEKATGIYFALPTQLTSNKIYDRFNAFLQQIVSTETPTRMPYFYHFWRLVDEYRDGRRSKPWWRVV